MITLGIFIFLTVLEYVVYRVKRGAIEDAHQLAQTATHLIGGRNRYDSFIERCLAWFSTLKPYLLAPVICLVLFLNLVIAGLTSLLWSLVQLAYNAL